MDNGRHGGRPDPLAVGGGDPRRFLDRARQMRAEAMAKTLARGGRLVQKRLAGMLGGGERSDGRGWRWRDVGARHT